MIKNRYLGRSDFYYLIGLLLAIFPLLELASRNFAKTDDYVFLGLMRSGSLGTADGFKYFSSQEWTAGRWVTNFLLSLVFDKDLLVSNLYLFRIGFTVLLFFAMVVNYWAIKVLTESEFLAFLLSLVLVAIPGFQSFVTLLAAGPYILGILFALVFSFVLSEKSSFTVQDFFWMIPLLFILTTIYQPLVFLILLYPSIKVIVSKFNQTNSKKLFQIYTATIMALGINWLIVRFSFEESRASVSLDISKKFHILFENILSLVEIPWLTLVGIQSQIVYVLVVIILLLQILTSLRTIKIEKMSFMQFFAILFISLGGIPFTFLWFFFIGENALDYRRYSFATTLFIFIFLFSVFSTWRFTLKSIFLEKVKSLFFLVICVSMYSVSTLTSNESVGILSREWSDFVCASEQVKLAEQVKIRSNEMVHLYQGNRVILEDFKTASISFSNPPTFMLWLSQLEAGQTIDFPPWNMNISYDLSLDSMNENDLRWLKTLIECSK